MIYAKIIIIISTLSITACGNSGNNESRKVKSTTTSEYDKCMSDMANRGSRAGLSFSDNHQTAKMVCDKYFK